MGNVTITPKRIQVAGNRRKVSFDVTLSASYATNGDSILPADLAKLFPEKSTRAVGTGTDLNFVDFFDAEAGPAGHSIYFDRTNLKIKAFNGTTEIANTTNLSTVVVRCMAEWGDGPSSAV